MVKKSNKILLFVSMIPENIELEDIYPAQRQEQIDRCSNIKVKIEKFYAWKMLTKAISEYIGEDISKVSFCKNENGKWSCDKCFFSLSHSDGVVAVVVSRESVGVDIEHLKRYKKGIERLVLTDKEHFEISGLSEDKIAAFTIKKWTQKESIFKMLDKKGFSPTKIEVSSFNVNSREMTFDGEKYMLSVAADDISDIELQII